MNVLMPVVLPTQIGSQIGAGGTLAYNQYLQFTTGDYLSTPHSSLQTITGDLEVVVKAAADNWLKGSGSGFIMAKYTTTTNQRAWFFGQRANERRLQSTLSPNGTSTGLAAGYTNDLPIPPFSAGATRWLRARWNQSTKAYSVAEAPGPDYPEEGDWTALSMNQSSINISSIFASTAAISIGASGTGTSPLEGKIYHAELRQGFGGDVICRFNASAISGGTYQNIAGETAWTIHGSPTTGSD